LSILAKHGEACYASELCRDVAQLGSALLWGSRGRRFKSSRSDLAEIKTQNGS
jgi:hypothetical protein